MIGAASQMVLQIKLNFIYLLIKLTQWYIIFITDHHNTHNKL